MFWNHYNLLEYVHISGLRMMETMLTYHQIHGWFMTLNWLKFIDYSIHPTACGWDKLWSQEAIQLGNRKPDSNVS